jgi:hypothetical protein
VIGRVYRGSKVGGLVRYLYGPGRHNEHVDQRLVACWSGADPRVLAVVEPEATAAGERDYRGLIAELEAPMAYAERMDPNPVWHCPLRTAPGDRVLTDAEWAEVAADLMHRTGIAPRGDEGACRWIAVRHDEESIHVVAVLARQDGARAHVFRDYPQVRATCLAAEQKYGLTVTAPADKTAATHTTRAEVERAARTGHALPARDWLREQVQHAAAGAREPGEFLDQLRVAGVVVRERRDPDGGLSGYAVGRREPGYGTGDTVFYGGGKLAADLSLPKLQARWVAAGGGSASLAGGPSALAGDRAALWSQATQAAASAAEQVREHSGSTAGDDLASAGDAAAAAAEVLTAASRLIEGDDGGPLTRAARDYDRAAREVRGRLPEPTVAGTLLRTAALQMARGTRSHRSEAAQILMLVAQIGHLSQSVAALREAQGRSAQAAAARRAALQVGDAAEQWSAESGALVAAAQRRRAAVARPSTSTSTTRRPSGPTQGPGRSR